MAPNELQLKLVAEKRTSADTPVSQKKKLIARAQERPRNFTWDEACKLMKQCGFKKLNRKGSGRWFVHASTGAKVRLHQPHPQNTLLPYMVDALLEALKDVGEIPK